MRALFFPQFYYIQYPPFRLVIRDLVRRGVDAALVDMPHVSELDERAQFGAGRFEADGVPVERFPIVRFARPAGGAAAAGLQMAQFVVNRGRLARFLRRRRPDVVVIGSHLGQMYIRQLQVFCRELGIPVVSLWITADTMPAERPAWPRLAAWLGVTDILTWTPSNAFTAGHLFVTTGDVLKRHMMGQGIPGEQIAVTGNPLHDDVYRALADGDRSAVLRRFGLAESDRYCVLLTECIQDVPGFGMDYLRARLREFGEVGDALPSDVKVVVRFHPREPDAVRTLWREWMRNGRYRFSEGDELVPLLRFAEVAVGHHTRALETALAAGIPCLSLNFQGRDAQSLFPGEFSVFEVRTPAAFRDQLVRVLDDKCFRLSLDAARVRWLRENVFRLDGRSTERIAAAVLAHAAGTSQGGAVPA